MWGTIAPILGGVVTGALASGGGNDTKTSSASAPWGPQQPYLQDVFGNAQNIFQQSGTMGPFQGAYHAGMNPIQQGALGNMVGYSGNAGTAAGNMFGFADQNIQAGQQGLQMAQAGPQAVMDNYNAMSGHRNALVDAASRDVRRNLFENEIPQNNLGAAAAGQGRGSRAGAMEGVMRRGAADRIADIGAQVDDQLMGRAQGLYGQQMGALNQAGQFGSGLYAGAYGLGRQGISDQLEAGGKFQADQQAGLNAQRQQWQDQYNFPWQNLQNYSQAISGNYGGTTNTTSSGQSPWQTGLGTAMSMYGLLNK